MMMTNRLTTGAIAAALAAALTFGGTSVAQTDQTHEAHHPGGAATSESGPAQPPHGMSGMMSGKEAQGGMSGMMNGDMGPMMQMMHRMMANREIMETAGPQRHFERIDARLAYVHAALRITDAQTAQWTTFADAARAAAGKLHQAYAHVMQDAEQRTTATGLLDQRIALLSARLDAMKSVAPPAKSLYAALSQEQKQIADELLAEHLRSMSVFGL